MEFLAGRSVEGRDLIASLRSVGSLAALHRSVSWFCGELGTLKPRAEDASAALLMSPTGVEPPTGMTPAFANMPVLLPPTVADELQLPLSREMSL